MSASPAPALALALEKIALGMRLKGLEVSSRKDQADWNRDADVVDAAAARLRSAETRHYDDNGTPVCQTETSKLLLDSDLQSVDCAACLRVLADRPFPMVQKLIEAVTDDAAPALPGETPAEPPQEMGAENLLTEGCRPPTPTIQQQRPSPAVAPVARTQEPFRLWLEGAIRTAKQDCKQDDCSWNDGYLVALEHAQTAAFGEVLAPPLAERVQAALTDEVLRHALSSGFFNPDNYDLARMRAVLLAALAPTTPQE